MQDFIKSTVIGLSLMATSVFAADIVIPPPPMIEAKAHVLIDADSGKIIVANNENEKLPPASLTKLLTSYIVEERLEEGKIKEQDLVTISEKAWRTGGSRSFMELGSTATVIDLLRGVIIQSGNDASVALAEHISGSDTAFTNVMNQYAEKLGLKNSHFMNPEGLQDPNHYSTAYDIALLSKAIIDDHPDYYKIYAEKDFVFNGIKQGNRNTLLYKDSTVDGLKTGHTEDAGYCLAASAVRDGMRLISVVMGTDSFKAREVETAKLLDYGFRYFKTSKVYDANQVLRSARVWKGIKREINLGVKDKLYVTLPRDQESKIESTINIASDLIAPIQAGQAVGSIDVTVQGKPFMKVPLIAIDAVEEAGFFKRVWDSIALFFHHLMS